MRRRSAGIRLLEPASITITLEGGHYIVSLYVYISPPVCGGAVNCTRGVSIRLGAQAPSPELRA